MQGALATACGPAHCLAFEKPVEALRALCTLYPDTVPDALAAGSWQILVGPSLETGRDLDEDQIHMLMGAEDELFIVPSPEGGGKGKGAGKILLGLLLVVATVYSGGAALGMFGGALSGGASATAGAAMAVGNGATTITAAAFGGATVMGIGVGKAVMMLGTSMLIGGISQAIAPKPELGDYSNREDNKPSYLFNGAVNTVEEGGPVPLAFGTTYCGSQVISSVLSVATIRLLDNGSQSRTKNTATLWGVTVTNSGYAYYGYESILGKDNVTYQPGEPYWSDDL